MSNELILKAEVSDSSGGPALTGTVLFEYCSYKRRPPNDLDRADEAPTSACQTGLATWDRLGAIEIAARSFANEEPGTAIWNFGLVRIPRTVGFRFRYVRGTAVASGGDGPDDFTWTTN